MRTGVYNPKGYYEVQDLPMNIPEGNEVVLRVEYCAMNHCDLAYSSFSEGAKGGIEVCGTIASFQSGNKDNIEYKRINTIEEENKYLEENNNNNDARKKKFKLGQRVLAIVEGKGLSEFVVANLDFCVAIPDDLKEPIYSYSLFHFVSAYNILLNCEKFSNSLYIDSKEEGEEKKEENNESLKEDLILINAGNSLLGLALIQLFKLKNYKIIILLRSHHQVDTFLKYNPDYCIVIDTMRLVNEENYLKNKILDHTNGKLPTIVIDLLGPSFFMNNLMSLNPNGKLILCGDLGERNVKNLVKKNNKTKEETLIIYENIIKKNLIMTTINYFLLNNEEKKNLISKFINEFSFFLLPTYKEKNFFNDYKFNNDNKYDDIINDEKNDEKKEIDDNINNNLLKYNESIIKNSIDFKLPVAYTLQFDSIRQASSRIGESGGRIIILIAPVMSATEYLKHQLRKINF